MDKAPFTLPSAGELVAFNPESSEQLADIPARITRVWPRFRSGDCLVSLEYPRPVRLRNMLIQHVEAFASEVHYVTPPEQRT